MEDAERERRERAEKASSENESYDESLSAEEPTEASDNDSSVSKATDYIPYEPDDSE